MSVCDGCGDPEAREHRCYGVEATTIVVGGERVDGACRCPACVALADTLRPGGPAERGFRVADLAADPPSAVRRLFERLSAKDRRSVVQGLDERWCLRCGEERDEGGLCHC